MDDVSSIPEPTVTVKEDGYPRLACGVEGCRYVVTYGNGFEGEEGLTMAKDSFVHHRAQHLPGRTTDIRLSVVYSGWCSNCGRGFTFEDPEDGERIWCQCGANWDVYGENGRLDDPDSFPDGY